MSKVNYILPTQGCPDPTKARTPLPACHTFSGANNTRSLARVEKTTWLTLLISTSRERTDADEVGVMTKGNSDENHSRAQVASFPQAYGRQQEIIL